MPPDGKEQKKKEAAVETDEFGHVRPILNKLLESSANITSQDLADAMSYFIEREKKASTTPPTRPEKTDRPAHAPSERVHEMDPMKRGVEKDARLILELEQKQRKRESDIAARENKLNDKEKELRDLEAALDANQEIVMKKVELLESQNMDKETLKEWKDWLGDKSREVNKEAARVRVERHELDERTRRVERQLAGMESREKAAEEGWNSVRAERASMESQRQDIEKERRSLVEEKKEVEELKGELEKEAE